MLEERRVAILDELEEKESRAAATRDALARETEALKTENARRLAERNAIDEAIASSRARRDDEDALAKRASLARVAADEAEADEPAPRRERGCGGGARARGGGGETGARASGSRIGGARIRRGAR